jgi:release factor glutamine methyltransferase
VAAAGAWAREADAPTAADLATELEWLLEDAVAAERGAAGDSDGDGESAAAENTSAPPWRPTDWRALERDSRRGGAASAAGRRLALRAPLAALDALWSRRLAERAPLQYLLGAAHWRDLVLAVGPGVLVPRPETELLAEFALEAAAAFPPALAAGAWADLGTGSGALAVALARGLPAARAVYAIDLAAAPAAYAAANAARAGVAGRVRVLRGSWFEPLETDPGPNSLAGLVSNPPYVAREALPGLQAEVRLHEPGAALDGGAGAALDALAAVCAGAPRFLRPGGFLGLETGGGGQAEAVAALLEARAGAWAGVRVRADLRGVARFVTARRA